MQLMEAVSAGEGQFITRSGEGNKSGISENVRWESPLHLPLGLIFRRPHTNLSNVRAAYAS